MKRQSALLFLVAIAGCGGSGGGSTTTTTANLSWPGSYRGTASVYSTGVAIPGTASATVDSGLAVSGTLPNGSTFSGILGNPNAADTTYQLNGTLVDGSGSHVLSGSVEAGGVSTAQVQFVILCPQYGAWLLNATKS